jgi:hypothetical protein
MPLADASPAVIAGSLIRVRPDGRCLFGLSARLLATLTVHCGQRANGGVIESRVAM